MDNVDRAVVIAASSITNQELAYLADLFAHADNHNIPTPTPGWSAPVEFAVCGAFLGAAKIRGIKNGVVVVTQTVDLRS